MYLRAELFNNTCGDLCDTLDEDDDVEVAANSTRRVGKARVVLAAFAFVGEVEGACDDVNCA